MKPGNRIQQLREIKIGVIVALKQELATLGDIRLNRDSCADLSENLVVCLSGTGAKRARIAAKKLIDMGADALVSWGTAAGLSKEVSPGMLIIPGTIISNDGNYNTDPMLRATILSLLPPDQSVMDGSLIESDKILVNESDKTALNQRSGAKAADMESAAVAMVAKKEKIPFVSIRVIADSLTMRIPPSVFRNLESGTTQLPGLIMDVLLHPGEWMDIIRLADGFLKARRTLKKAAGHIVPELIDHNSTSDNQS